MYLPRHFAMTDRDAMLAFMRAHSFAVLVSTGEDGAPFATHLPVLVSADGSRLLAHIARANPHGALLASGSEALVVFSGPHAYVSPRWYASAPQVPTWNYVAVHAYGRPQIVADEARTREMLAELSARHEGDYPGAWSFAALPEPYVAAMVKGVLAFEIPIERLEGKAKLSQNKPAADVQGAVEGLRETGEGEALSLAQLMEAAR